MSTDPETLHATVGSPGLSNVWVPGRSIWTRKTCGDIELLVACTMQTVSLRQVPVLAVYRILAFRFPNDLPGVLVYGQILNGGYTGVSNYSRFRK
jgi:hypothetical protein